MAAALARGGPILAGAPSVLGGTKYYLDVAGVPSADRAEAVRAAAVTVAGLAPGGAVSLSLGSVDPNRLRSATRVYFNIGAESAAASVERLNGSLPVPRRRSGDGGSSRQEWQLPVRQASHVPTGAAQLSLVGMSRVPDALQRVNFSGHLLAALGWQDARIIAEFHPTATVERCLVRLSEKVVVWAEPPPGKTFAALPSVVDFAGSGEVRLYVDVDAAGPPPPRTAGPFPPPPLPDRPWFGVRV